MTPLLNIKPRIGPLNRWCVLDRIPACFHREGELLRKVAEEHPLFIGRFAAINILGCRDGHSNARLEYRIMRINDTLPLAGWRIITTLTSLGLEAISLDEHERLAARYVA